MAFTTYVNTDVEFFLRESFSEALSTMHFSWDQMVKGERYHPATASAGQYRFLFAHPGGITLRRQSPRRSDREAHRYRDQRLNRT